MQGLLLRPQQSFPGAQDPHSTIMSQSFALTRQKNGSQSFKPALEALPEAFFHGWCYEKLKEFYEESEIRFQIHQQSNMDEKQSLIRLQKALLNEGQLHDAPGVVATLLADFEIDDDYLKAPTKKQ